MTRRAAMGFVPWRTRNRYTTRGGAMPLPLLYGIVQRV